MIVLAQHVWELILFFIILLGPLPLCLSLVLSAENGKQRPAFSHSMLVLLCGWCILETCIGLVLGMIRNLTLHAVLIVELFAFFTGVMVCLYARRYTPSFSFGNLLRLSQPLDNLEVLIVGAVVLVGVNLLGRLATQPIFEYDSLAYHLPAMAKWYQTGSLAILEQFDDVSGISRYPYNWEVLGTLFMIPFREDFLVALPNLVAWLLLGLSVYGVSVGLGALRIHSMAAAALVSILPIVLEQLNTLHVDVPFAAFFMAGLYFVILYNRTRSFVYFALFLATLGMLSGIKSSGLVYGALLVALLALMRAQSIFVGSPPLSWGAVLSTRKLDPSASLAATDFPLAWPPGQAGLAARAGKFLSRKQARPTFRLPRLAVLLGVFVFLGGFWYLRNLIEIGNPLGHVNVQFAGLTLFPGDPKFTARIGRTTLATLFQLTNLSHWNILWGQVKVQLQVPFMAMALSVLVWPLALFGRQRQIKKRYLIGLMMLLIITAVLYWITPYSADNGENQWQITPWLGEAMRYAVPFLAVLGILAASVASAVRVKNECVIAITLFSLGGALGSNFLYVALYVAGILLLSGGSRVIDRMISIADRYRIKLPSWLIATAIVAGMILVTFVAREMRDGRRSQVYGGVLEYIQSNINPDETLGYLWCHRSYLLYGKELDRRVVYIPPESDNLHEWIDAIQARGVSVVALGPLPEQWRSKQGVAWLEDANGPFVRVYGQDPQAEIVLYRIK